MVGRHLLKIALFTLLWAGLGEARRVKQGESETQEYQVEWKTRNYVDGAVGFMPGAYDLFGEYAYANKCKQHWIHLTMFNLMGVKYAEEKWDMTDIDKSYELSVYIFLYVWDVIRTYWACREQYELGLRTGWWDGIGHHETVDASSGQVSSLTRTDHPEEG